MLLNFLRYIRGTIRFFFVDLGIAQLYQIISNSKVFSPKSPKSTLEIRLPSLPHSLTIRPTKADILVLWQTFGVRQCDVELPPYIIPKLIIDAGANIGSTAVFFAIKYPFAQIIAVEPHWWNVELARINTDYYPNIKIVEGAVYHQKTMLEIANLDAEHWAFQMRENLIPKTMENTIRGFTIDEIANGEVIDILKVDIEGAEKQLFAINTKWLSNVRSILVECHGYKSRRIVSNTCINQGFKRKRHGEYDFFSTW